MSNIRSHKTIWHKLDRACGELDNAMQTMAELDIKHEEISHAFDAICSAKNEIEEKILANGGKLFNERVVRV